MIGFIGAMQIELDGIRANMTDKHSVTVSGVEYVIGKLGKNEIVTAVCGVGKVFAANTVLIFDSGNKLTAELRICRFNDSVLCVGRNGFGTYSCCLSACKA